MKKIIAVTAALAWLTIYHSATAQTNTTSFAKTEGKTGTQDNLEQTAIHNVIEAEVSTRLSGNYEKWASTWLHDSTAFWSLVGPNQKNLTQGWNDISLQLKPGLEYMRSHPLTSERVASLRHFFNDRYLINSNMAFVTLKVGLPESEASDKSYVLTKQNGTWKIVGVSQVNTAMYNFKRLVESLKNFVGDWKMDIASSKAEPSDGVMHSRYSDVKVHETPYGLEAIWYSIQEDDHGNVSSSMETEQYIINTYNSEVKYFHVYKNSQGYVETGSGHAVINNPQSIAVTVMYEDKPEVKKFDFTNTLQQDGKLHIVVKTYDSNGKLDHTFTYTMSR